MFFCAWLQRVCLALIGDLSIFVVLVDEVDVEVALSCIEVMVPNFHSEHKITALSAVAAEGERFGVIGILVGAGRGNAEHVKGAQNLVRERHE